MRWIRAFAEGSRDQRELLGGKGAGVAEMTRVLGADRVPAGFTITTEACVAYMEGGGELPAGLADEVDEALAALEERAGKRLGDPGDPLLVSVRSGARVSMPGMLDTVLNLGLNDDSVAGLAEAHRRRALRLGLLPALRADVRQRRPRRSRASRFEDAIAAGQDGAGVDDRHRARRRGAARADGAVQRALRGRDRRGVSRSEPREQLARRSPPSSTPGTATARSPTGGSTGSPTTGAPRSTCSRWSSATAATPRARASPSAATSAPASRRRPATSSPTPRERTWSPAPATRRTWPRSRERIPEAHAQLLDDLARLEAHYEDMQDVEFTIEEGRLFLLQTRAPNAPPRPRCASRSTRSPRGC